MRTLAQSLSASLLLSGPPWNSLCELTLFGFYFISHPTIEILSLMCCQIDQPLVLPPHTLPRLKRLSTETGSTVANSVLTIAIPRPLKFIRGSLLNDAFRDSLEQSSSGPNLDKLITLYNGGSNLGSLITGLSSIAPHLEWLDIGVQGHIVSLQFDSRIN